MLLVSIFLSHTIVMYHVFVIRSNKHEGGSRVLIFHTTRDR